MESKSASKPAAAQQPQQHQQPQQQRPAASLTQPTPAPQVSPKTQEKKGVFATTLVFVPHWCTSSVTRCAPRTRALVRVRAHSHAVFLLSIASQNLHHRLLPLQEHTTVPTPALTTSVQLEATVPTLFQTATLIATTQMRTSTHNLLVQEEERQLPTRKLPDHLLLFTAHVQPFAYHSVCFVFFCRAKSGENFVFDISEEACRRWGFYHAMRVITPRGTAKGYSLTSARLHKQTQAFVFSSPTPPCFYAF